MDESAYDREVGYWLRSFEMGVPLEKAQATEVVVIEGLLTHEEVLSVLEMAAHLKNTPPVHLSHTVKFLHGKREFQKTLPGVFAKLTDAVLSAARDSWGVLASDDALPCVRVIEFHEYALGGSLKEKQHFDEGSLVTIDVMLSPDGAFKGGEFRTWECDGEMRQWPLANEGDAVLFLSHKYHSISPLTGGTRNVLIMETWLGQECQRSHRCLSPQGCDEPEAEGGCVDLLDLGKL